MPPSKTDLAKIHIAKQQLGMDDETYRAMLRNAAGVASAKALDARGLVAVMQHLKACGFKPKAGNKAGRQPNPSQDKAPLMSKVTALLAAAGRSWAYADGMAKHMFKVERVAWLDYEQLRKLVQALVIDAKRRAGRA